MKKCNLVGLALLSGCLAAHAITSTAISKAHYGLPTSLLGAHSAKGPVPLTISNNTYDTYNVKLVQANGERDKMPIYGVNQYPMNVISIDNPAWPVHVEIFTQSGDEFYNNWVSPDQPNVKLNPSFAVTTSSEK